MIMNYIESFDFALKTALPDAKPIAFPDGDALKTEGQAQVAEHNHVFMETMRTFARNHAVHHGSVTSDDLRLYAAEHGLVPKHPNAWGAIFHGKGWKAVGYTRSKLPSNHARTVRVWEWSER